MVRPVRQGRYLGFDAILPAAESGDESWRSTIDRDELVQLLDRFAPAIPELVRRAPETEVNAVALGAHLHGAGPDQIPAALQSYSDARAPIAAEIHRMSREMSPFRRLKPAPND